MMRLSFTFAIFVLVGSSLHAQISALDKPVPETLRDLRDIEDHVQRIAAKVMPATVCLRIGNAQGSGVIVDREGHILTAGHVSGAAGREATIIFSDGRRARGKTLGANNAIDSGMVILTDRIEFTHVEMGRAGGLKRGQWCLAFGHPNGYKPGRPPVVRLGRVQAFDARAILTDCTLVGGDSGGPLFDMDGRVIGIHSRIGGNISSNLHVPMDTYRETWSQLAAGDVWGGQSPLLDTLKPPEPYLGLRAFEEKRIVRIEAITPGSPADKAGLRINDVIVKIDNRSLTNIDDIGVLLRSRRPGNQISLQVQRGSEMLTLPVTLGKRAN